MESIGGEDTDLRETKGEEPVRINDDEENLKIQKQFSFSDLLMRTNEYEKYLTSKPQVAVVKKDKPQIVEFLYHWINEDGATVFLNGKDAQGTKVVDLLKDMKLKVHIIQTDAIDEKEVLVETLLECTGMKEFPIVFVKGKLISDLQDLWYLQLSGLSQSLKDDVQTDLNTITFDYHLILIGSGSNAISAAVEAGKLGKQVALIDSGIDSTSDSEIFFRDEFLHFLRKNVGRYQSPGEISLPDLIKEAEEERKREKFSARCKLKEAGVQVFYGRASFKSSHIIEVSFPGTSERKMLTSSLFIIATGKKRKKQKYLESTGLQRLRRPGRVMVVAASARGLEVATCLPALGHDVTLLVTADLEEEVDKDVLRRVRNHLVEMGVNILERIQPEKIQLKQGDPETPPVLVTGFGEKGTYEERFDGVLVIPETAPNTAHMGLTRIGVNVDPRTRRILVDADSRTNITHVMAIGSAALNPPKVRSGKSLVERGMRGREWGGAARIERFLFPVEYCLVSRTGGGDGDGELKTYTAEFQPPIDFTSKPSDFYLKALCRSNGKVQEVICVHLLSEKASEFAQGLSLSMKDSLTLEDLRDIFLFHPLLTEVPFMLLLEEECERLKIGEETERKSKLVETLKRLEEVARRAKRRRPPVALFPLEREERVGPRVCKEPARPSRLAPKARRIATKLGRDLGRPASAESSPTSSTSTSTSSTSEESLSTSTSSSTSSSSASSSSSSTSSSSTGTSSSSSTSSGSSSTSSSESSSSTSSTSTSTNENENEAK